MLSKADIQKLAFLTKETHTANKKVMTLTGNLSNLFLLIISSPIIFGTRETFPIVIRELNNIDLNLIYSDIFIVKINTN